MKRLMMAAVVAVGIHGLLLMAKPPWHAKLQGIHADTPISLDLQVFSKPGPEEEAPEPIDTPRELPGDDPPVPDPVDENLPEPLPEPPPQPEPEPSTEAAGEPEPVPESIPEREVVSEVEPEPDPVPRREPEQAFVPGREPEPEPAEKSEDVPPVDEPKEAQNTAAHDPLPEDAVKSTPKRKSNSGETKRPGFDPPPRENVESASDASVKKNRPVSEPSPIPGPPAPAIVEAKPKYLENDPPHYPRVARRRGYSGTVVVQVLVNRSGRAEEVQLASSSGHRILDKAALSAVSEWRFEPGTKNGIPVSMRVKVPVRFSLR